MPGIRKKYAKSRKASKCGTYGDSGGREKLTEGAQFGGHRWYVRLFVSIQGPVPSSTALKAVGRIYAPGRDGYGITTVRPAA